MSALGDPSGKVGANGKVGAIGARIADRNRARQGEWPVPGGSMGLRPAGFWGWLMSRLRWRFQVEAVALMIWLTGAAVAASEETGAPRKEGAALLAAVMQGQLDAARQLLSKGVAADTADRYRVT